MSVEKSNFYNWEMVCTKVSVITICYNCVDTLQKTIDSVIAQKYLGLEYIIIDGASKDGTVDIIKRNECKITKWLSEPDDGIYDAMGKGLRMATGDWIIFMNAGDRFASYDIINRIFAENKIPATCAAVFGDMIEERKNHDVLIKATPFFKSKSLLPPMGFSHQSVFLRTSLAKEIGFDESFKIAADYAMVYRIYQMNPCFFYIPMAIGQIEPAGFSHCNKRKWLVETADITKKTNKIVTWALIELKLMRYHLRSIKGQFL